MSNTGVSTEVNEIAEMLEGLREYLDEVTHSINRSSPTPNLNKALAAARGAFDSLSKDRDNPYFKSKYATLGAVYEATTSALSEHGLTTGNYTDSNGFLTAFIRHESGEHIQSQTWIGRVDEQKIPMSKSGNPTVSPWQAFGIAQTYASRYLTMGLLGIAPFEEDNDGNDATAPQKRSNRQYQENSPSLPHSAEGSFLNAVALSFKQSDNPKSPMVFASCVDENNNVYNIGLFVNQVEWLAKAFITDKDALLLGMSKAGEIDLNPNLKIRAQQNGQYINLIPDDDLLTFSNPFIAQRFAQKYQHINFQEVLGGEPKDLNLTVDHAITMVDAWIGSKMDEAREALKSGGEQTQAE